MKLRGDPARQIWGAERVTTAYLASILALLAAGLVGLVAYPIVNASGLCANDPTDICQFLVIGSAASLGGWAALAGLSGLLGLGLAWALWMVLVELVSAQLVVTTSRFQWLTLLLVGPVLAAAASATAKTGQVPPVWRWGRWAVAGLIGLQWSIWLVWLTTGSA
ncbi:MAG: hypothetical protein LBK54_02965 [Propionibacteriaceae bacterium]|jgi:hypothetical protein|nr:hypothetical protein [Propionibacteriaceae bacterium]